MAYKYKTQGTCASQIVFDVEDDKVKNVQFIGGCAGNTKGVSKLVEGMPVDEVIEKLKGIQCHGGTSCPDQLTKALEIVKKNNLKKD